MSCGCGTCADCSTMAAGDRPSIADPVAFRHGAVKQRMLDRIASTTIEGERRLDHLGTRQDDDPVIAVIDAFAASMHVLAANAAYLSDDGSLPRTADRRAIVELTRLLGYEARPALAATTTLAFTLDALQGSPGKARIPRGTKVASVPGQDEKPLTFETDAELHARAAWNSFRPIPCPIKPSIGTGTRTITIVGANTTAKVGDVILAFPYDQDPQDVGTWISARVLKVTRDPNPQPPGFAGPPMRPRTYLELAEQKAVRAPTALSGLSNEGTVIVLGQRAAAFGATAPKYDPNERKDNGALTKKQWDNLVMDPDGTATGGTLDLDAVYPDAVAGRAILFTATKVASKAIAVHGKGDRLNQKHSDLGVVTDVREISRADFAISAKASRITVSGINLAKRVGRAGHLSDPSFRDKVRDTTILIETSRETLWLDDDNYVVPRSGNAIVIDGIVDLPPGRLLVLAGLQDDKPASEVAVLEKAEPEGKNGTRLTFSTQLANHYSALSLTILGNTVPASQAETPVQGAELLGSGDATRHAPRFALKGKPLAYLPASNARGYAPALDIWVGERRYDIVPTLHGLPGDPHAYTVKTGRDGASEIQFAGRLPTGQFNVRALYRTGGGAQGNLPTGRITTALSPVLGVNRVVNPVPADGGSEPETIDDLRLAAPQSVRALDRAVSLADYETFARGFRGVGKAMATELRDGMRRVVCLTIATTSLQPLTAGSALFIGLRDALIAAGAPGRRLRVEGFVDINARITADLTIDIANFDRATVEGNVRRLLAKRFGAAGRNFGEALPRSAVVAAIQSVDGVLAVSLSEFTTEDGAPPDEGRLLCPIPTLRNGTFSRGGLLSIRADDVRFGGTRP